MNTQISNNDEAQSGAALRAAACYASYVYRGVRGANDVEVKLADGKPITVHSVIKEFSGRIRYRRIWTVGKNKSMRIRCAILHALQMHNGRGERPGPKDA